MTSLRPADEVMRLTRMGSFFPTRLSFMRSLIRRMSARKWTIGAARFDLDDDGYGLAVYEAHTGDEVYSLVCFSHALDPARRTDRVIAEAWDATFALFDGRPAEADLRRLADNLPKQEAGRFTASELCLSRANKSLRLFDHIVERLASGRQPDMLMVNQVGYLMRTTAVYGNGKFGLADRDKHANRPALRGPFMAELLSVYLTRCFTLDLVEHVARRRDASAFAPLDPAIKRFLGIGNATGLGMAPFLMSHPILINNWITARETALARVRALPCAAAATKARFTVLVERAVRHGAEWNVGDNRQMTRIYRLREDLAAVAGRELAEDHPWDEMYRWAIGALSIEGQEMLISLMLEPHGDLIDDLADQMAADETAPIDPAMTLGDLRAAIAEHYGWALEIDFNDPLNEQRIWYVSEEKLEPRLGDRHDDLGISHEMPFAIARDVQALDGLLAAEPAGNRVAEFLGDRPDYRYTVRRVQTTARLPYAEIRSNLIGADCLPIDLLRCKLSFFGASKFDPRSDRWTRITMYQGAPLAEDLHGPDADDWLFPVIPRISDEGP